MTRQVQVYTGIHEYFREQVEKAITTQVFEPSVYGKDYLVNILTRFHTADRVLPHQDPQVVLIANASMQSRSKWILQLRDLGDLSLFICGFFTEKLDRSLINIQSYSEIGRRAYETLGQEFEFFREMSREFIAYSDLLSEVRTNTFMSNSRMLRLYENWLRTGKVDAANRLLFREVSKMLSPKED